MQCLDQSWQQSMHVADGEKAGGIGREQPDLILHSIDNAPSSLQTTFRGRSISRVCSATSSGR